MKPGSVTGAGKTYRQYIAPASIPNEIELVRDTAAKALNFDDNPLMLNLNFHVPEAFSNKSFYFTELIS